MSKNPFIRFRERLDSHAAVRDGRMSDEQWLDIVSRLNQQVGRVDGGGFAETPVVKAGHLAQALELDADLWIKSEVGGVAGSHKARHLMGVAIGMLVDEALGADVPDRLAIASCGNAALAAGVIAAAMKRPLAVFVPTWADETIVAKLEALDAVVHRCERRDGEAGDPAYLRFQEAVADGAVPFSVQGTDTPTTFDGGRTLGWELAEQLPGIDRLYIQVGGGALATSVSTALPNARLFPVQAEGCAPLRRAWDLLDAERGPDGAWNWSLAEAEPERFMTPWDNPHSLATGILDDITYDWLPLLRRTVASGGEPIVAREQFVEQAWNLAHAHTDVPVCTTGSSGLAGLLERAPDQRERIVLLFTGIHRG